MKCSKVKKMVSPYVDEELGPPEKRAFELHIWETLSPFYKIAPMIDVIVLGSLQPALKASRKEPLRYV